LHPLAKRDGFLKKYIFISLLRAVESLTDFGSLRDIQEGGEDGEGLVKRMRKMTPRSLRDNFAINLLERYSRQSCLEFLCEWVKGVELSWQLDLLREQESDIMPALEAEEMILCMMEAAIESGMVDHPEPLRYKNPLFGDSVKDTV
jgi:hypothetical protein